MSQKQLNNEELETRLQFYKLKAEHLEKQLSEKGEELAELKDRLEYITGNRSGVVQAFDITDHDKAIRHQICEEIREKAQKENRYIVDHEKLELIDGILYTISNYVLDQIEQGEKE